MTAVLRLDQPDITETAGPWTASQPVSPFDRPVSLSLTPLRHSALFCGAPLADAKLTHPLVWDDSGRLSTHVRLLLKPRSGDIGGLLVGMLDCPSGSREFDLPTTGQERHTC